MGLSIALVGGGPRAVFALERLAAHGVAAQETATVTVFDPNRDLGVGAAYEADLPAWARVNLRASAIDAGLAVPGGSERLLPSFEDWRRELGGHSGDQYPPRALAGRYLSEMAARLARPWDCRLRHVRETVLQVERGSECPTRWQVQTDRAAYGGFDEVLMLTGHAPTWAGRLPARVSGASVIAALPLPTLAARVASAAGDGLARSVLVRGAALTAIDATLACTIGRGAAGPITWWSRTGQLMEAKPGLAMQQRLRAAMPSAGPMVWAGERPLDHLVREAATVIVGPARAAAIEMEWARLSTTATGTRDGHCADSRDVTARALRRLRASISVAAGRRPPDARWALGEAWRWLYPVVVQRGGNHTLDGEAAPAGWPGYRAMSPELERLAFGPPLVNARILASLMATGRLRVQAGGAIADALRSTGAGLVVDAVLAPPGLHDGVPLWPSLAERGLARRRTGCRGVDVDSCARVIGADGAAVPGLSAAGRITEDVVIGNDTLTRVQHPGLDRWGARMAARTCSEQPVDLELTAG